MAFTQAQLLAIAERFLPDEYLAEMKAVGPGYELLQAFAKMLERCSTAIARVEQGSYFTTAAGGSYATAAVEFYRDTNTAGQVTVKAGTVLSCSRGGQQFFLAEDAIFNAPDLTTPGTAVAVAQGWEWNVPGPLTTPRGELLPGDIDTIDIPLQSPAYGDPTIRVRQTADATGGAAPMLDGLADDRGITREENETDASLSVRARTVPDVVSPPAIARQLDRFLGSLGIGYERIRWWEFRYQSAYDVDPTPIAPDFAGAEQVFLYDDPRDPATFPGGWRNRWDGVEAQAGIVIVIDNVAAVEDYGLVYDDPATTAAGHHTARGKYAAGAYDMQTEGALDVLRPAYDGPDVGRVKILSRLNDLMATITGGVPYFIELRGQ